MERFKFQDRLRRSFIGYISVIVAVVTILFIGGFVLNFATIVVGGCRESVRSISAAFQASFDSYLAGMDELAESEEILRALEEGTSASCAEANRCLYSFSNGQSFRSYFVLLGRDGEIVCSNFNDQNRDSFVSAPSVSAAIARLSRTPSERLCFVSTVPLTGNQSCSYIISQAVTGRSAEPSGYLFFNLRTEDFRTLSRQITQDVLITDRYDNVIFTTLDLVSDPMDKLPEGKFDLGVDADGIVSLNGELQYVSTVTATDQNSRFYTLTSLATRVQALWYGIGSFLLLFLILILVVWMLTRAFARQNTKEIQELTKAVYELGQGRENFELSSQCSQESQELYTQFRGLTMQLREVVQRNSELQDRRRQMEVKQLEEQFDPHFVFNMMEMIRFQMQEDTAVASEMLLSFANLMRYSIAHNQTRVSLETDIEYVSDYLLLQKARYNNCLQYEFDVPDELLECQIPKLLLQPVIENSLKHGFQNGKILTVIIAVRKDGDNLRFMVSDDGAGISPDRLGAIRETFGMELNSPFITHIGLYNTNKILGLLYGTQYGVTINSTKGKGTVVTLTMPYETEDEPCC